MSIFIDEICTGLDVDGDKWKLKVCDSNFGDFSAIKGVIQIDSYTIVYSPMLVKSRHFKITFWEKRKLMKHLRLWRSRLTLDDLENSLPPKFSSQEIQINKFLKLKAG